MCICKSNLWRLGGNFEPQFEKFYKVLVINSVNKLKIFSSLSFIIELERPMGIMLHTLYDIGNNYFLAIIL